MRPCPLAASRTACIFSLFSEANCSIFFGSPVTFSVMITDMASPLFSFAFVGRSRIGRAAESITRDRMVLGWASDLTVPRARSKRLTSRRSQFPELPLNGGQVEVRVLSRDQPTFDCEH